MEMVTGRSGVRSGRAVVGLDVVSHTLPRTYRAPAHRPCCPPPTTTPPDDDVCSEPGCAGCHPDLCSTHPALQCPAPTPYPAHLYPSVLTSGWDDHGIGGCVTCSLAAPPCACPDPRCAGTSLAPSPCPWGCPAPPHATYPAPDIHMSRAASDCTVSTAGLCLVLVTTFT